MGDNHGKDNSSVSDIYCQHSLPVFCTDVLLTMKLVKVYSRQQILRDTFQHYYHQPPAVGWAQDKCINIISRQCSTPFRIYKQNLCPLLSMINISHSSVFQQVCIFLDGFPSTREQMDDRQQTMNNGLDNGREYEQDCVAGTRMGAGLQLDNVTITV